jgi:hypothetical protein
MRSLTTVLAAVAISVALTLVLANGIRTIRAQDGPTAQIGIQTPLPVHVTNEPVLPSGFTPGSRWRFTTWTSPSVITWVGQVQHVSGPWAQITVSLENQTTTRWYYVPAMPGSWERQ